MPQANDQPNHPQAAGNQQREQGQEGGLPRYRRLRRAFILIPFLAALVPLMIMAAINYYQDANAYRSENRFVVSRLLSNTKRSLHFAIEERRALLSLIARSTSLEDLSSDARLMAILRDLRESFGDFVDLGLIDSAGYQPYYAGPYDLRGAVYRDQPWFHEVSMRGVYVSDVFMGYRKFPHFVIAIAREMQGGEFYLLRASINTDLLNRQMFSLELSERADMFIMNRQGILQTTSAFYGDVLDTASLSIPPHIPDREVISDRLHDGDRMIVGFADIEGSPFVLVALLKHQAVLNHWLYKRSGVIWFLFVSVVTVLAVVYLRSKHIINRLQESDSHRAKVLHNIEYTNKMATLGRLAASVAHEINNPLAIINEKAGLITDIASHVPEFPEREKVVALVHSITSSVDRCARVTRRLLGFGRRMEIRKEQIDLKSLVIDVLDFQKTEASHRNIRINLTAEPDVSTLKSDKGKLQQVFLNIVGNAYAAVGDGGQIDIVIHQPDRDEVAVTITDNGHGIAGEDLKHIFEPFFSTKGEMGTGLGLSITRDIVEKLGGVIEVRSEVGKGTSFIVNLPVEKVD